MTTAIEVSKLGKRYWQLQERAMLLRSIVPFRRAEKKELWALRNLNFELAEGQTLGIIGRNGAGKTTLLRLLAGVSRPTEGTLTLRGRIAPLIGIGVGFHLEMTGRENVLVNGMLLGCSRRQLEQRMDEIVEFAELEEFLDTPVKFYSSGMMMRLGFSVAAHVAPDILLVDEVLAVGDAAFQLKCYRRMSDLQANGTTIVIVSHSLNALRLLCPRTLLIRGGEVESDGPTEETIARYHELLTEFDEDGQVGGHGARIINRTIRDGDRVVHQAMAGDQVTYAAQICFDEDVVDPQVYFQVVAESGIVVYTISSNFHENGQMYPKGAHANIEIPLHLRLAGGTYRLELFVSDAAGRRALVADSPGLAIYVTLRTGRGGLADLDATINLDGAEISEFPELLLSPKPRDIPTVL